MKTTINDGELKLSVHDQADWVYPVDLLNYKLAPADIPIAKFIQEQYGAI